MGAKGRFRASQRGIGSARLARGRGKEKWGEKDGDSLDVGAGNASLQAHLCAITP